MWRLSYSGSSMTLCPGLEQRVRLDHAESQILGRQAVDRLSPFARSMLELQQQRLDLIQQERPGQILSTHSLVFLSSNSVARHVASLMPHRDYLSPRLETTSDDTASKGAESFHERLSSKCCALILAQIPLSLTQSWPPASLWSSAGCTRSGWIACGSSWMSACPQRLDMEPCD